MTDLIRDEFELYHDHLMAYEDQMVIRARKQSAGIAKALADSKGETGSYKVLFADKTVKTFKVGGKWSFYDLVHTMERFNSRGGIRCLSVSRVLRGVNHTVYADMKDNVQPNCNIKAKNPVLSEIYCL
jgi:hypothetical protein